MQGPLPERPMQKKTKNENEKKECVNEGLACFLWPWHTHWEDNREWKSRDAVYVPWTGTAAKRQSKQGYVIKTMKQRINNDEREADLGGQLGKKDWDGDEMKEKYRGERSRSRRRRSGQHQETMMASS
jgi:hypothetical protein